MNLHYRTDKSLAALPASQGVKAAAAAEVSALSSAASPSSWEAKDDGVLLREDDGHASSAGSKERSRSGRVLDVRTRSLSYSSAACRSTFLYLVGCEKKEGGKKRVRDDEIGFFLAIEFL